MYCLRCSAEYPDDWKACPKDATSLVPTPSEPPSQHVEPYVASDPAEHALVEALRANPADVPTALVYADWLESRGDPHRAKHIREEIDPPRDDTPHWGDPPPRSTEGTPEWRVLTARASIWCQSAERASCPGRWDLLASTSNDLVRTCATCRNKVEYCCGSEAIRVCGFQQRSFVADILFGPIKTNLLRSELEGATAYRTHDAAAAFRPIWAR